MGIGCVYGILNAGLVILLGQIAYFATPILVVTFIGLFFFDKFPLYKLMSTAASTKIKKLGIN